MQFLIRTIIMNIHLRSAFIFNYAKNKEPKRFILCYINVYYFSYAIVRDCMICVRVHTVSALIIFNILRLYVHIYYTLSDVLYHRMKLMKFPLFYTYLLLCYFSNILLNLLFLFNCASRRVEFVSSITFRKCNILTHVLNPSFF